MNSKLIGKPKHLFVVKEESPAYAGKMLSAESLTADQQLTAKRYIGLSQSEGIVIGALVRSVGWDVRPLLLQHGELSLLRFSDPAIGLQKSKLSFLRASCDRLLGGREPSAMLACGEVEGQVWTRRKYFQHTLADEDAANQSIHALQITQKLIRLLSALHAGNSIHGHICPQNVALEKQEIFLFDHSYLVAGLPLKDEVASLAPELKNAAVPTFACDVFGLGLVIRSLPGFALGPEQEQCVERMLLAEPSLRPSLEAVREVFMPREAQSAKPTSVSHIISSPGVSAGKLVAPLVEQKAASVVPTAGMPKIITPNVPVVAPNLVPEWRRNEQPAAAQAPQAPDPQAPSGLPFSWLLAGVLVLGAGAYVVKNYGSVRHFEMDPNLSLEDAWASNQPSRMQPVAEAAVEGDSRAILLITSDALKGNARPLVRTSLLRNSLNSQWEGQLSSSDREIILRLALAKLLPGQRLELPPLSRAHPAIAFAVAGDMPDLQSPQASRDLTEVSLERLSTLPAPYGEMFEQLARTGVSNLGELPARGLSHILSGDASESAMAAYFSGAQTSDSARLRLAIVFPLAQRVPKIQEMLLSSLDKASPPLSPLFEWFSGDDMAQWTKVQPLLLLTLLMGELPTQDLSFEQYSDLLVFPDAVVRESARKRLAEKFFDKKAAGALQFLASKDNHFTRFQSMTLLSAFKMEGEPGFALLGSVLSTKPNPASVLGLLLARSKYERLDPINVELSRYLAKSNLTLNVEQLRALASHPEQLARALAYARLDPQDAKQREILENAVVVEPNTRLRGQVEEKLKGIVINVPDEVPPAAKPESDADLDSF